MNQSATRRVALKIDCDTFVGTRDGIPRLLEIFGARQIRASFFFTFGPDRSGVAARRFFTTPGFLKKMLRSRAVSLYGFPTVLFGTLLPAPVIGEKGAEAIASVARAGHETGVHAWDHVAWHDNLDRWSAEKIREQIALAHAAYERIFGEPATASAAAGWTANSASLAAEEERGLLYTSNSRLGAPFFPKSNGRVSRTLEIPTTLATLDETLAWPGLADEESQRRFFREAPRGTQVHTVHTEVEGRSKADLFERILDDWIADGTSFVLLSQLAREALLRPEEVPVRDLARARLPGRGGTVASGWAEAG